MKLIISIFLSAFISITIFSQSLRNGYNVYSDPIQSNPAFTGTFETGGLNFTKNRTWLQSYDWFNINYQTHIKSIGSGIGINYTNKSIFSAKIHSTTIAYAYQNKLTDKLIWSVGLSASIDDYRNLSIADFESTDTISYKYANAGGLIYGKKFFISIGLNDIQINTDRPPLFKIIYGYRFNIGNSKNLSVIPNFIYTYEGSDARAVIRINTNYKKIRTLIGIRTRVNILETGIGYSFKRILLQYQFNYDFSNGGNYKNIYRINNYLNIQIKIPMATNSIIDAFDFNLF